MTYRELAKIINQLPEEAKDCRLTLYDPIEEVFMKIFDLRFSKDFPERIKEECPGCDERLYGEHPYFELKV